jgi:hypothetical protein
MARSLGATGQLGLLGEINLSAPNRSKASDGGIGDASHAARVSDHNPCRCTPGVNCPGRIVTARDFTHDVRNGFDAHAFAEWLRGRILNANEQRVKYVISNRRIMSGHGQSHKAGLWRAYNGSNPHVNHTHVSVRHPARLFDDASPWGWHPRAGAAAPTPPAAPGAPAVCAQCGRPL